MGIAMTRRVFYSFHYKPDNWRASQVRNIGKVEGNKAASDNDWETVTKGGESAIKKWIDDQMDGRSCVVVLIGRDTANRKWIDFEIAKAWKDKKGLLGIYIQDLKDTSGNQTTKGGNPFVGFTLTLPDGTKKDLSTIVKTYDPPYADSKEAFKYISENIESWIEEAIKIRNNF